MASFNFFNFTRAAGLGRRRGELKWRDGNHINPFLSRPYGRGGTQAEGLGGEGLADSGVQTLTSHRFAAGPSSPAKSGRGFYAPANAWRYTPAAPR
jgi:hypothetical protein